MKPLLIPTITVSDRLPMLVKTIGRQTCSNPIFLDLAAMEHIDQEAMQAAWLSEQERQQLSRLTLPKRRREWLAGRICAKIAIEDYLDTYAPYRGIADHSGLSIINSDAGRPYATLDGGGRMLGVPDISISHSSRLAAALAAKSCCGVDIQKTSKTLVRVKERFCTAREEDLLLSSGGYDNPLMHLALIWAAKEAAQKALSIVDMPGFLDLVLTRIEKTGYETQLFMFNRYHRHARLASEIRVLAAGFEEYGLGICIP
jgi:4'-phosphopantetheinyl transferase EntD